MSADQDIANAIAETIRSLGITPSTPLISPTSAGFQSATIDPSQVGNYRIGGLLPFWDGTREVAAIQDINPTTGEIALTAPLAHDHAEGAIVGTNLMTDVPVQIGPMIATGPVVFVYVTSETASVAGPAGGQRRVGGSMTARIQHHTALLQDEDNPVDVNLWALAQQRAARTNLAIIQAGLLNNWTLIGADGATALGLGDGTRPVFSTVFEHMALDVDSLQFAAVLDVSIRPNSRPFSP